MLGRQANGLPAAANVDGYVRVDATHLYLSFAADTTVPGVGTVQDEDVVYVNAGDLVGLLRRHRPRPDQRQPRLDAFDVP